MKLLHVYRISKFPMGWCRSNAIFDEICYCSYASASECVLESWDQVQWMRVMFHDIHCKKYYLDSLHRIDRGLTTSLTSHPPTTENLCVVVMAAGAWACFVCCETEVTHQVHWRRAYPCSRARDRMISCPWPDCHQLLNIYASECSLSLLLMCLLLKHRFLLMRRAWEPCLAEVAQRSPFSFASIPHLWMVVARLPVACACVLAPNSQIFVDR